MMINTPTVYYQKTKNTSFLKMYKYLKDLGVKNNKFFLALYDKGLEGIDPYLVESPILRARIVAECKINPWYYLREVVRLRVPGGFKKYELHRGNLALTYCLLNNIDTIELLPRQNGKTVGVNFVMSWVFFFGTRNAEMIYSNKKLSDAQLNLKRFEDVIDILPKWLVEPKDIKKDHENYMTFTRMANLHNKITVIPSANSADDADKLGRGMTIPIIWCDEFAFLDFNDVMYEAAAPALSQATLEAENNHSPHFKVITTTPNSIDKPNGQYCKNIINLALDFDEKVFYDIPVNELHKYVDDNSENNFVHIEFTWQQLGRDKAWYRRQCKDLMYNRLKIKREVDLEWTLSSDKSPFSEEELERVSQFIVPEDRHLFMPIGDQANHKFTLLETIDYSKPVILACDIGAGFKGDYSVVVAIDAYDGHTIGGFWVNNINPIPFARIIKCISVNIFPNSTIVVERNSYGLDVITTLVEDNEVKNKVFYRVLKNPKPTDSVFSRSKEIKIYGIDTSPSSREIMISNLFLYVTEEPHKIRLPRISKELKTLERKTNGKIEHTVGEHDDTTMAYLIGRYAMTFDTINFFRKRRYFKTYDPRNIEHRETIVVENVRTFDQYIKGSNSVAAKIFNLNK